MDDSFNVAVCVFSGHDNSCNSILEGGVEL
jgi:hypothetical protein